VVLVEHRGGRYDSIGVVVEYDQEVTNVRGEAALTDSNDFVVVQRVVAGGEAKVIPIVPLVGWLSSGLLQMLRELGA
jgi:hypothetical protein